MLTPEMAVHTNVLPRIAPFAGLQVREDTAYTDASGVEKAGLRKRAEQDLREASEILSRLVRQNETVLYLARGAFMPNNWEQLLDNHASMAAGALLAVTNTRLIALRTRSRSWKGWKWDQGILSVEWASIVEASKKGWLIGYLILKDVEGRKERFFRFRRQDLNKLRLLFSILVPQASGLSMPAASVSAGFVSLCPKCLTALSPRLWRCNECGLVFKNEKSLLMRTLLIPGGAYFYTGQTLLGIVTGFIEVLFVFAFVVQLLMTAGVIAPSGDAPPPYVQAALVLLFLALIKLTGFYRSRRRVRNFIPA